MMRKAPQRHIKSLSPPWFDLHSQILDSKAKMLCFSMASAPANYFEKGACTGERGGAGSAFMEFLLLRRSHRTEHHHITAEPRLFSPSALPRLFLWAALCFGSLQALHAASPTPDLHGHPASALATHQEPAAPVSTFSPSAVSSNSAPSVSSWETASRKAQDLLARMTLDRLTRTMGRQDHGGQDH